jgi:peptidoglycan/LPS O-acetylase OafA/YrhL
MTAATARGAGADGFNVAAHGLRGLASMMVLVAHILGGTARHIYPMDAGYVAAVARPWYLGTFGVELFFIISGYVILPSALKYRPRDFALRRLLRIYPLFFVLSLLFVLLNAATLRAPGLNSWETVLAGLLFLNLFTGTEQLTPNAWSLTYEVMFYVLTCAVVHYGWRMRARGPAWLAGIAAAAFVAAFPIALFFLAGVLVRIAQDRHVPAIRHARWWEALALAAMVVAAMQGHYEYRWSDYAGTAAPAILLATTAYFYLAVLPGSLTARLLGTRFPAYAGTISYSLYLVHPYVYLPLRLLFARYGLFTAQAGLSVALFAVPVIAGSFLLSHYVHRTLEQWPYRRFFRQKIYHDRPAMPA